MTILDVLALLFLTLLVVGGLTLIYLLLKEIKETLIGV